MNNIVRISVDTTNEFPMIKSEINFKGFEDVENKEVLYTVVGILDNFKQKINYLIEAIENEDCDCEDDIDDDINDILGNIEL